MRIYVGGLSYSVNDEGLRALFAEFGEVANATVVSDRYSGQSKGFGFVEMADADQARAAISRVNGTGQFGGSHTGNEGRPGEGAQLEGCME